MAEINSLNYTISSVLADLNLPKNSYYQQFLKWAVDGYRAMNLSGLMPTIKSVSIPINKATNTAKLPKDYIDYIRVGVCCGGTFINFDYNDEICLSDGGINACSCSSNDIQNTISTLCANFPTGCNDCNADGYTTWQWGGYSNGVFNYSSINFGVGPGFYHGGYRIDVQAGTIAFDNCVHADSVVLEYKSTGFDDMGDALVPEGALLALREYIHWQRCRFQLGSTPYETMRLRQEARSFEIQFVSQVDDFLHRTNAMTKYDYLDIFRRYTFQQVKV